MPEIDRSVKEFRETRGIVLDLRGNPGGLGIMAMGIAGWFVSKRGQRLGTMISRSGDTPFEINPRLDSYASRLAILVDQGSASTTEILAQGLKDLGRAQVFGTRTAGAETSTFADYRDENGFTLAHHLEAVLDGKEIVIDLTEIKVNVPIPEQVFRLPDDVVALVQHARTKAKPGVGDGSDRPTLRRRLPQ